MNVSSSRRSTRLLSAVIATLLAMGTLLSAPAGAVQPGVHGGQLASATSPAGWTPHVLDGYVGAIAEVGDTMVIGGNFTQIASVGAPGTSIARPYIFSFQKGTGQINSSFSPVVNGEVTSILPTGDGQTVWIAGGFNSLNGQTVRNIAKVDLATGQRVTQFAPPALNGQVTDLRLRNGTLYLTGRFTKAGAASRPLLAAVDPLTGALDPNVRADFTDPRKSSFLTIGTADISPDGTRMVVAGNFTKVNGQDRYQIAMLDLTTSPVSVANWQTTRYGDGCSKSFPTYMRDVDFSPDGSQFAVVTTGAYSAPGSFLCDAAASWDAHATGTGLQPNWVNYTGGDTLTAVAFTDTAVYVGGHQRWLNNPYAADRVGAGAVPREGLGAMDPRSGSTLTWNPGRARGVAVYALLATNSGLWIGSDTDRIANDQYRGRLAFMPLDPATTMPTEYTGQLPGQVVSLGLMRGFFGSVLDRTTSRQFTGTTVTGTAVTAEGTEDWSSLRGSFMVDGKLYTGWNDATFRVQDFNGTTFGPQSTIPLALVSGNSTSLNRFASEDLATITGMFYDAAAGRIYFTKTGSTALHYRSFSPQSRIVGGERISSAANAGGVDWSSVQTMFMADGKLYTSSSSGNLVARTWSSVTGLPTGTATTVSGPGIDGQDWYARDAFVYATAGVEVPNTAPTATFTSACTDGTCGFDASASTDPDGAITSYVWDFGDSTAPGAGVNASHIYATSGTYTVTLSVTDNRGAVSTTTRSVQVVVPNRAPVAAFTPSCTGLTCTFDSSASSDPDGSIVGRDWTFGDGATSSASNPTHTYAAAGARVVSLTVTDDRGATATTTTNVSVIDPNATPSVGFRAATGATTNSTSAWVSVPSSVQAGDLMVLFASAANSSVAITGPAGWTPLDAASDATASAQTAAWTRTATAADANSTVSITSSSTTKMSLQLAAYDGAASVSTHQVAIDTVSRTNRTTPTVNVTVPGSALISYWGDKSNDNVGWDLPAEATLRDEAVGTGNGHITSALADSLELGAGPAGGLTAVADSANRRGLIWSVVIAPDTATPNALPTASFTSNCTGRSCSVDASASTDPDGTIASYSWTFGDGAVATQPIANHTYAAPGSYTVTLTVTDDDGATNTATRQLTVTNPAAANVAFRAATGTNTNSASSTLTIPAQVQPGDLMVMIATTNTTGSLTGPAGWTLVDSGTSTGAGTTSALWSRVAAPGDAGSTVAVSNTTVSKTALQLAAYANAGSISARALSFDGVNRAERTTPIVPVVTAGSALVSYWADKSGATTAWALPGAVQQRDLSVGVGGGHITAALADTGSLAAGTVGGLSATADSSNPRGVAWSIVIAPAP